MAHRISLYSPDEGKIISYTNVQADITSIQTIIYRPDETIRLISEIESIDIKDHKIVIYYKSGFYLVIIR